MVHQQTLAMALALDWSRSCRFWRLFVSELADLGRPVRLSPTATRALSHVVLLALERDCRLLSQSAAASNEAEIVGTQEIIFTALGFVCTIASWIKFRPIY